MTPSAAPVEQAIFILSNGELNERGASAGLDTVPSWRADAERLMRAFGTPPTGTFFSHAMFAQPFGSNHVAIVQATHELRFRFLILPRRIYLDWIRDPFLVDAYFPPNWDAVGPLPSLDWPLVAPPPRTVETLQKILEHGGSQTLLGAVQALVDGGRVVFERPLPAPQLMRDLWNLLPDSVRGELWPATFACSNDLRFDLLVVPKIDPAKFDRYVKEELAVDYPEGRYEFELQYAIEHGDHEKLRSLLGRRCGKQVLRTAIFILIVASLGYLGVRVLLQFLG